MFSRRLGLMIVACHCATVAGGGKGRGCGSCVTEMNADLKPAVAANKSARTTLEPRRPSLSRREMFAATLPFAARPISRRPDSERACPTAGWLLGAGPPLRRTSPVALTIVTV